MYPILYYLVSAGLIAGLVFLCLPTSKKIPSTASSRTDTLYIGLALLLLVVMRLPSVFYNRELNVDESQLLAQAITIQEDPVYGRSVDGTSIGPINTYLLLIPSLFGLPVDYTAARLVSLLLIGVALGLFYRSLGRLTTVSVSRLSFLPVLLFFASTTEPNFLHYSSELSSLVILTACFDQVITPLRQRSLPTLPALAGLGFLAGLTVYCKLQTLPIVGMMLLTLTIYLGYTQRWQALNSLLILGLGFLVPTLIVFGHAYWFNTVRYFIDYYFVGNLTTYGQIYAHVPLVSQGFGAKLIRFPFFIRLFSDFLIFIGFNCGLVLAIALVVVWYRGRFREGLSWTSLLVGLTLIGGLWSVITPGTEFAHHLLLLVFPVGWALALALHQIRGSVQKPRVWLRLTTALLSLYVLELLVTDNVLLGYVKHRRAVSTSVVTQPAVDTNWQIRSNPYLFSFPTKTTLPVSPVSQVIKAYTTPLDKLAVWGWNCRYYVETGLAQGVRENHTQRSSVPNWMQAVYLNRYAQDLLSNRPAVFVDAVGPTSLQLTTPMYRHERFGAINRIIGQQYKLVDSVDQARIYVRHNRLNTLNRRLSTAPMTK